MSKKKTVKVMSITFRGKRAMLPDPSAEGDYKVDFDAKGFAEVLPNRAAQLVLEYPNDVIVV